MTHRSSAVDIMATLLEHGHPMTRRGLTHEIGVVDASIERSLKRLMARGLVEKAGQYVNPGTGRKAMLFAPGPLVRLYAMQQKPGAEE